jgi:hypothetical protein
MLLDKYGWPVEQVVGRPVLNFIRNLIHGRERVCRECWERSQKEKYLASPLAGQCGQAMTFSEAAPGGVEAE